MISRKTTKNRLGIVLSAAIWIMSLGTPAHAQAFRNGLLIDHPMGYLNCVHAVGSTYSACIVAYQTSPNSVHIVIKGRGSQLVPPTDTPVFREIVEEADFPASNLELFTPPQNQYPGSIGVSLTADFPITGAVQLRTIAYSANISSSLSGWCPFDLNYDVINREGAPVVAGDPFETTGSVSGLPVVNRGHCGAFFFGPVSGHWEMPTPLDL